MRTTWTLAAMILANKAARTIWAMAATQEADRNLAQTGALISVPDIASSPPLPASADNLL